MDMHFSPIFRLRNWGTKELNILSKTRLLISIVELWKRTLVKFVLPHLNKRLLWSWHLNHVGLKLQFFSLDVMKANFLLIWDCLIPCQASSACYHDVGDVWRTTHWPVLLNKLHFFFLLEDQTSTRLFVDSEQKQPVSSSALCSDQQQGFCREKLSARDRTSSMKH